MKITLLGLIALLLPLTASAQLVSVQPGTGRVATTKTKKAKEPKQPKQAKETKEIGEYRQSNDSITADFKASLVSQYLWRGQELSGLSFQPSASVSWRGLSLIAEGSTSLDKGSYRDLDLTLRYRLGPVTIGVTDYWSSGIDIEDRYLYYDAHKGGHIFEGNLDWQLTVGGTPMESAGEWETVTRETIYGESDIDTRVYEYAEGAACCLASLRCTKEFHLGDIRLPVFAELNANPYLSKGYFIMGVSIKPW